MARPKVSKNGRVEDDEAEVSSGKGATFTTQSNNLSKILEQLVPALVAMQQTPQQILQFLMNSQMNQGKEPIADAEQMIDDPV